MSRLAENSTICPAIAFDTSRFAPKDQLDAWMPMNGTTIIPPDRKGIYAARMETWLVDRCTFITTLINLGTHRRHRALLHYPDNGKLVLRKIVNCGAKGTIDGKPIQFRPGQIHIYPMNSRIEIETYGTDQLTVYIPFDRLRIDPLNANLILPGNSPPGNVIGSAMDAAFGRIKNVSAQEMARIIDMLCGLIDALLAKKPPETAHQCMDRARGMAIRSYILQNLGDPMLTVERIMQKFAASRATIYREFQSDGGIARFVTIKRLDRARRELAHSAPLRGIITETALRCGFWDTAAFCRAFRARFGETPSDVLGSAHEQYSSTTILPAGTDGANPSLTLGDLLAA